MTCGDLPLRTPIGSFKGHMHSESHPLDIGLRGFIGAGLVLFLALRTLTKSSLREIGFIWFMIPRHSWPL